MRPGRSSKLSGPAFRKPPSFFGRRSGPELKAFFMDLFNGDDCHLRPLPPACHSPQPACPFLLRSPQGVLHRRRDTVLTASVLPARHLAVHCAQLLQRRIRRDIRT